MLNHPLKVIISAISILIAVNFTYTKVGEGVEFFPDVEPDLAKIVVFARGNLSVEEKKDYVVEDENVEIEDTNIDTDKLNNYHIIKYKKGTLQ